MVRSPEYLRAFMGQLRRKLERVANDRAEALGTIAACRSGPAG